MDRNRLLLFIAISAAITFGFQYLMPGRPHPVAAPAAVTQPSAPGAPGAPGASTPATPGAATAATPPPMKNAPRLAIMAPRVQGSISLRGARIDDIQLRDYHDTVQKTSPLVRLLTPAGGPLPSYVQLGWSGSDGVKVPDDSTIWTASGGDLTQSHPVTLSWDNGAGLTFSIALSVDDNYMFAVRQSVHNAGATPVTVLPWQRARRDYAQPPASYGVLFEGMLGTADNLTHQMAYPKVRKTAGEAAGTAYTHDGAGGWSAFTDKYWLTALVPDQAAPVHAQWYYGYEEGTDHYQVSYQPVASQTVAPGADAAFSSRVFIGAKEVHLLDRYEIQQHIPLLSYAVDWGMFYFLTKPFFYAIDFLFSITGNFGIAILIFTLFVKLVFYPLASKSYESMGKMRLLAPKVQAARERYKDDPTKQQTAMMEVYKEEGINPAAQLGGCMPMVLQIPVFFSLYKVILVTIELRHAPFFGWIRDLSATDPTNIFNLFGLLPFDPTVLSPTLHLGVWPLVLGTTMFFQQKLNPPPPDPVQAKMFQFMPLIFMFMMGRFPAGLVIYWCWNNTLTIAQQWWIQRRTTLKRRPGALPLDPAGA